MRFKSLSLLAAVLFLAACSSQPKTNEAVTGGAGAGAAAESAGIVPGSEADLKQNVGDRVFFAVDKSDITAEGRASLEKQAAWLAKYPAVTVTVEGHADERGTREYNLALGERRANAVKKVLGALGVPASRVQTISYGKERPEVVGSTEAAWAQNRRGVTVVN